MLFINGGARIQLDDQDQRISNALSPFVAADANRSVRAAARCEMAGVARPLAAVAAIAPAPDFRNVLRSMIPTLRESGQI